MKKYRLLLIDLAGRMNRNNCVMGLRLCASAEAIARMQKVWAVFELATQERRRRWRWDGGREVVGGRSGWQATAL